jgi:hypothetical protein
MWIIAYCGNTPTEAMVKTIAYYRSLRHTVVERNPIYFDATQLPIETVPGLVLVDSTLTNKTVISDVFTTKSVTVKEVLKADSTELVDGEDPETVVNPFTVPGAPTIGTAVAGNTVATVPFTAPANKGGTVNVVYTVTSNPAGGVDDDAATSKVSHHMSGLTNAQAYTFTVKATNCVGEGAASAASNSVTPS